jgi:hypothetical protein
MARALVEQQRGEEAMDFLEKAQGVIAKYTGVKYAQQPLLKASVHRLLVEAEDVKQLQAECEQQLKVEKRKIERLKLQQRAREMRGSSSRSKDLDLELVLAVSRGALQASLPGQSSPEGKSYEDFGLLPGLTVDGSQAFSLESKTAAKATHLPLPRESSPERQGEERQAHDVPSTSPQGTIDNVQIEDLDPQLILAVVKSAFAATKNCLLRDSSSLRSPTSATISSHGEATDDEDISSIGTGGSVKRVSFCTSPPQVLEYELYHTEPKKPRSTNISAFINFDTFDKKRRMWKKKLGKLTGDDEESAAPGQGAQSLTRVVKKVGQTC